MQEITDAKLAEIRADLSVCSPLVQSLVKRVDRVEGERDKAQAQNDFDCSTHQCDLLYERVIPLQQRITELTQCDPSWYDASPADAFMLLKKAQERVKRMEEALKVVVDWQLPKTGRTWDDGSPMSYGACYGTDGERNYMREVAQAALKESE